MMNHTTTTSIWLVQAESTNNPFNFHVILILILTFYFKLKPPALESNPLPEEFNIHNY